MKRAKKDAAALHSLRATNTSLRRAREDLAQERRSRIEFLANMSQEIRTPLNAIVGLTHVLRRAPDGPARNRHLDQVSSAARQLLAIFNDVLDLSKMESGQFRLATLDFSLDTLLLRSCTHVAEAARRKGLELVIHAAHRPRSLRGDLDNLVRALANLLDNAVKFSERGGVTLSVSVVDEANERALLRFEVRDTGSGIEAEGLERLFTPFGQVDTSSTRHRGGTGVGLAIASQLARLMGGDVGVKSQPGAGSTFWLTASLQTGDALAPPATDESLKGRRVLLVDDLPDACAAIAEMLSIVGLRTDVAESGPRAIAMAEEAELAGTPYEVIVVDRFMPGMDGLETARALMAEAGAAMPAFMMVSASVDAAFLAEAAAIDITSVLQKPFSLDALHGHLLRVLLDRQPRETAYGDEFPEIAEHVRERLRGARVLLAEDHPINQMVATKLLQMAGCDVDVASSGARVVELCCRKAYDVVLMDVHMPGMDGLEATRRIRALPGLEALPVIAMTANAFAEDRAACLAAGMNAHLSKPVDPSILYTTLARWLPARVGAPAGAAYAPDPPAPDADESLAALACCEGLAIDRGLRFFGNDSASYCKALASFVAMYASGLPEGGTSAESAAQAQQRLGREIHSLAGASAAIGATSLQAHAAQLDAEMRLTPQGPDPLRLEALNAELTSFTASLAEHASLGPQADSHVLAPAARG